MSYVINFVISLCLILQIWIFFQNYTPRICTEFLTWAYGRRDGERRRKSVRGCIVSQDLSVTNLVIVKKGENDLPGLTNTEKPRMRGPKRASKIRKLFNLSKDDDVRKYVNTYRRTFTTKNGELSSVKLQRYLDYFLGSSPHLAILSLLLWISSCLENKGKVLVILVLLCSDVVNTFVFDKTLEDELKWVLRNRCFLKLCN